MRRRHFLALPMLAAATAHARRSNIRASSRVALSSRAITGRIRSSGSSGGYITGWVNDGAGRDYGVQVTFFRNRPGVAEANPSAFAPRQLLFAHAAIADPRLGHLSHDQRAARAGLGLAEADEAKTGVVIGRLVALGSRRPLCSENRPPATSRST
jgi:hypothetical protein